MMWRRALMYGTLGSLVVFAGFMARTPANSSAAAVSPMPAMMSWMQDHTGHPAQNGISAENMQGGTVYEVFGQRPHKTGHAQPTLIVFCGNGPHKVEFISSDGVTTRMFTFRHLRNVPARLYALHGSL